MFIAIYYLKHFYLIPLNLRVSSVVNTHSFSRSSYLRSLSSGMSLVALLCIFSSISMSFLSIWTPCLYTIFQVRSNYCFIQGYNQTLLYMLYFCESFKNLVAKETLQFCIVLRLSCQHSLLPLSIFPSMFYLE